MAARLSVVVPVLDEAAGITSALRALVPLRARGHEVIVVDGGSADASVELARPLADRVLAAPRGRAAQMNAVMASNAEAHLFNINSLEFPKGHLPGLAEAESAAQSSAAT